MKVKCDYCERPIPRHLAIEHITEEDHKKIKIFYCEPCFKLKQVKQVEGK